MPIQYLNCSKLQAALTAMWQKDLGTSADPANGQWYTNGPNNDHDGLYGGLTDSLPVSLTLDTTNAVCSQTTSVCVSQDFNNIDGSLTSESGSFSYPYATTLSYTQTAVGASVDSNVAVTIDVNTPFEVNGVSCQLDFTWSSLILSHSALWGNATISMPVDVPFGKVYRVVLTATRTFLSVPYTADITVTGMTETWFASAVNGFTNWQLDAANAFAAINQYAAAGADSVSYGSNGSAGIYTLASGNVNQMQYGSFVATITDVTSQYAGGSSTAAAAIAVPTKRLLPAGETPPLQGTLVATHRF